MVLKANNGVQDAAEKLEVQRYNSWRPRKGPPIKFWPAFVGGTQSKLGTY